MLYVIYFFYFSLVHFCLHYRTATKESRFLSRCSLAQARVKTLATVLATPLSLFIVSFYFRTAFSVCRFRPPETAPFSSAAAARPRISGPNLRPARRCQPFSCAPTASFQPTVAIRPRLFITQSRSDHRCQPESRDLDRACFL